LIVAQPMAMERTRSAATKMVGAALAEASDFMVVARRSLKSETR